MHLSYPALFALSRYLQEKLPGLPLTEAYSQEKDELMLNFSNTIWLKIRCAPALQYIVPLENFERAGKNSADLFPEIVSLKIDQVKIEPHDRILSLHFGPYRLICRMFGNKSNILLIKGDQFREAFLKKNREEVWFSQWILSRKNAPQNPGVWMKDLEKNLADNMSPDEILKLCAGAVWEVNLHPAPTLGLNFREGLPVQEALSQWMRQYLSWNAFHTAKEKQLKSLEQKIKITQSRIQDAQKAALKLKELRNEDEIGHIILAHAHQIRPGDTLLECEDLYRGGKIQIPLKTGLSPAEAAEAAYQKSKNRKQEISRCQQIISDSGAILPRLETAYISLRNTETSKDLKIWKSQYPDLQLKEQIEVQEKKLPWREFILQGWNIRVGRDAKSNDELTLKYSKPGDLWLHVKDYSGSHVILRKQMHKVFPEEIIQKAAELAVWYSPRRHHELVPVWVCDRKNIRKNKKMPPGAVHVERGETRLADSPKNLNELD